MVVVAVVGTFSEIVVAASFVTVVLSVTGVVGLDTVTRTVED